MTEPLVALLRGINVGGHNKIAMAELREAVGSLGHREVRTYIQSGNVVFRPEGEATPEALSAVIADRCGVSVPVVLRTGAELEAARAASPFAGDAPDKWVMIGFYDTAPPADAVAAADPDAFAPDRWQVVGDEVHLLYPEGSGRSKLTIDKVSWGSHCTARNLRTVDRLIEMARSLAVRRPST